MAGIGFSIQQIKNWQNNLNEFWKLHPSANKIGAFRALYDNDKSKDKSISSKKAWYCILYIHPESDFYNLNHTDKLHDLAPDLFPSGANYLSTHEELNSVMESATKACLSQTHKHLAILKEKLLERAEIYATTKYTIENAKILDDMLKNERNLIGAIQECEDIIKQSNKDGTVRGSGELSLMESKGLFS